MSLTRREASLSRMSFPTLLIKLSCLLLLTLTISSTSTLAADPIVVTQPNSAANQQAGSAGGGSNSVASSTSINPMAAAGGITITKPAQTAQASYYKIASGVPVTFAWNFTSIINYPSSLFVYAYCSENSNSYPIAASPSNGLNGRATQVIWDPYSYSLAAAQSNLPQLIQATYRLKIFDERGENVGASGGLFQPNTRVEFALYIPSRYTPLAG